jgi:4-amino-4-deoxy-L-arabinose transferase-like glycosyltransferase
MLYSLINFLTPHYRGLKNSTVFLLLTMVSVFIRLPFFFRDYIDRDESTFILMGQSWVDGYLPYMELWDLKPPITFAFFAVIIFFFGKNFFMIRLIGALIIGATAFYTYKIALTSATKKTSFWAAMACVALLSLFGSLQGVMSEHLSMAFFMPGLYVLIKKKKAHWLIIAGALFGLAMMCKLNLAYVALALCSYVFFVQAKKKNLIQGFLNGFLVGAGVLCIVLLTILPYYIEGNQNVWWQSVILASLKYADSGTDSIIEFLPITLFFSAFFIIAYKRKLLNFNDRTIQILSLVAIAILFSFVKGGRLNGHYLILLHPILIVLFAIFISGWMVVTKINYKPILFFILLLLPSESYLEYYRIVKNKLENGTFYNGEGFAVPRYITENKIPTKNILFLGYHIGYWILDTKPPTKAATHPSNICRSEIFPFLPTDRSTNLEELKYIMETIQPKTVVIRKDRRVFDKLLLEENAYINDYLQKHYAKPITVEKAEILVRLE